MYIAAAGDGLVHFLQAPQDPSQGLGILHNSSVGKGGYHPYTHVHSDGGPFLGGRRLLPVLHAEAGKPQLFRQATGPIFGRITVLPATFTVPGPLSARKPCSCFLRL